MTETDAALLPVPLRWKEERYLFEVPTAAQALQVLSVAERARAGQLEALLLLRPVLREWFPEELAELLSDEAALLEALEVALQMIEDPSQKEKDSEDEDTGEEDSSEEDAPESTWMDLAADYMAAYSCTYSEVMAEPWPAFLAALKRMGRHRARRILELIRAETVPKIRSDREREKAFDDLLETSGHRPDTDAAADLTPEEQFARLDKIMQPPLPG